MVPGHRRHRGGHRHGLGHDGNEPVAGADLLEPDAPSSAAIETSWDGTLGRILLGRSPADVTSTVVSAVSSSTPTDGTAVGPLRRHGHAAHRRGHGPRADGVLHQLPARGVTGAWDGSVQSLDRRPIAVRRRPLPQRRPLRRGWEADRVAHLPPTCRAASMRSACTPTHGEDRVPFFVRPAAGAPTADVAFLDDVVHLHGLRQPPPAHRRHRLHPGPHPACAPSTSTCATIPRSAGRTTRSTSTAAGSCSARDGDPCSTCGRAPTAGTSRPTPTSSVPHPTGIGHDIIADEDVHAEGVAALAPYRVVVTGTHPEYWSTSMLDALADWQRRGGRLMYLGGNGFYWRVGFSEHWPGAMELRRAEDGVRNWQTGPGESYHAFGGEYGGLWRRLGRAPNEVVGIGFAAQGFERATHYRVADDARRSRAAWILDGVDGELIGTSGLGGGAAGQEIDRYDVALGSPAMPSCSRRRPSSAPTCCAPRRSSAVRSPSPRPTPCARRHRVLRDAGRRRGVLRRVDQLVRRARPRRLRQRRGPDHDERADRFADPEPFPAPPSR